LLRSIASIGGLTLVSRFLGLARDLLTAALLGAGPVADAFFVAFRLPNNFRALLAEGAFNAAFVPVFSAGLVAGNRTRARHFAAMIASILIAVQLILLVLFELIMPWFMLIFAPGFAADPAKFALAVLFSRITFPYLLLISLVSLQGAVLNSLGRFGAAAAAPIFLNLCMIAALVFVTPVVPTAGHALAWGVATAGIAQFLYLAIEMRRADMHLHLPWPRLTPEVRRFFKSFGPAALGAGLVQINLFFDTLIASLLPTGTVSYLNYADRINQLPLGVIGIAIGTVLLPELSRHLARGAHDAAAESQNRAIEWSLTLTLPAAIVFLVAPLPIVSGLFQWGAFGAGDAAATAGALAAYAAGLPAFVLIKALLPGLYARADTRTPVRIALVAILVNIGLKLLLMGPLVQIGVALATSCSAWVNAGLLAATLHRRGHWQPDLRLKRRLPRLLLACLGLALVLAGGELLLTAWLHSPFGWQRLAGMTLLLAAGGAVLVLLAFLLRLITLGELRGLMRRARG
jgi:putative peptidoglycan lipid II flippase